MNRIDPLPTFTADDTGRGETDTPAHMDACNSLNALARAARECESADKLRGYEGYAAAIYFERLTRYFPEHAQFKGRNRRPPKDPANALLSWTYTIVLSEIDAALRIAGLDPCLGFFHEISYGRPSLSLDLLEPLRAPLCDMLVFRLFNHKLISPEKHFEINGEDGGTYLNAEGRKHYFPEYERTMLRRFSPSKGAPHTDFRAVIRDQAFALIHAMEKDEPMKFFIMP
jgi:CRISPR-associated protein Cas1